MVHYLINMGKGDNMEKDEQKYLCVICGEHIDIVTIWICKQCFKQCSVDDYVIIDKAKDKIDVTDSQLRTAKSKCCGTDVQSVGRLTCSEKCHASFIRMLEKEFGTVKKVTDEATGIDYRIPIKDIVERRLTWQDLTKYPQWEDPVTS